MENENSPIAMMRTRLTGILAGKNPARLVGMGQSRPPAGGLCGLVPGEGAIRPTPGRVSFHRWGGRRGGAGPRAGAARRAVACVAGSLMAAAVMWAGVMAFPMTARGELIVIDPELVKYKKSSGISGNLNSIGSDTLNNLMTYWSEGFRRIYPGVIVQVEGKGSSTAPPALVRGTAELGPMSRKMKAIEVEAFENKWGFKPTAIGVALDGVAIFVNKDNPVTSLSLPEVDAIYSKTRNGGMPDSIDSWDQLGLTGRWEKMPISLFGRNSASGTYGVFKTKALFKGDFKDTVKEQPGSASVVLGISEDQSGIGYSSIGYSTSGVKALALSKKRGGKAHAPSYENVLRGKYPLGRMLFIYLVKKPGQPVSPLVKEFIGYVLSAEGQKVVVKDGYLPLPAKLAAKQLAILK